MTLSKTVRRAALALVAAGTAFHAGAASLADASRALLQAPFAPRRVAYPVMSQGDLEVRVLRGSAWPLRVAVARRGAAPRVFVLPRVAEQVAQVRVRGQRLVVHSWMGPDRPSDVTVFDLVSGATVDDFWCYDPTFSPDGRLLAFVRFYPVHSVTGVDDQAYLYDAAASPEENRPAYGMHVPATEPHARRVDVGVPLYPLARGELGRDNTQVEDGSAHAKVSPFAWSADSRRVAYVDAQQGKASLVVVDVAPLLGQLHAGRVAVPEAAARVAALPALSDACDVQGAGRAAGCVDFAYDLTRLGLDDDAAALRLSTTGALPVTRTLRVDLRGARPVPR